jgi:hypothetical protein
VKGDVDLEDELIFNKLEYHESPLEILVDDDDRASRMKMFLSLIDNGRVVLYDPATGHYEGLLQPHTYSTEGILRDCDEDQIQFCLWAEVADFLPQADDMDRTELHSLVFLQELLMPGEGCFTPPPPPDHPPTLPLTTFPILCFLLSARSPSQEVQDLAKKPKPAAEKSKPSPPRIPIPRQ